MPRMAKTYTIFGQGLAGTCLAWAFIKRGATFEIYDPGLGGSSRVAAGLINPITGKNFEPSWKIEEFHPEALAFYQEIAKKLETTFWFPLPILRLASTGKELQKICSKLDQEHVTPWLSGIITPAPSDFEGAIELRGGGRCDVLAFIDKSREHFEKLGILHTDTLEASDSPETQILCTGSTGLIRNEMGSHRCAKGEILTVKADWPASHIRIGAGGWLVPIGAGKFRVGSTYEWDELDESPTPFGQNRISEICRKLGGQNFEIIDHVAGIRPIVRRSQPLIGQISSH